ncbi:hypothetical protein JHK87_014783 [Glycine soja]|nr:hypothetical protein JHK87_014783 [Glycine soja]
MEIQGYPILSRCKIIAEPWDLKFYLGDQLVMLTSLRPANGEGETDDASEYLSFLYSIMKVFSARKAILYFHSAAGTSKKEKLVSCGKSWVPSLCSLLFSLGLIWALRYKSDVEAHVEKMLQREKEDKGLLGRCVEELKKKGLEFDLLKEVDALRRAKSLRVENKEVRKWSSRDLVSLFFFSMACFSLALTRVILCT